MTKIIIKIKELLGKLITADTPNVYEMSELTSSLP